MLTKQDQVWQSLGVADKTADGKYLAWEEAVRIAKEAADIPYINGWTKAKILALPKGSRPDPATYLPKDYIDAHLAKFEKEGVVSRIVPTDGYNTFGIGKPDPGKSEFVSLKTDIDNIIKSSNGNIDEIAKHLGIPTEQLEGGLVRIDFKVSYKYKPKMPTGNEFGTNPQWIPGGK
ncbi:MAG: hypothetical protein RL662_237 [Bacteroidota bacterium]